MTASYHPGQRWTSESEPELGLGSILRVQARTVVVHFPASNETREYARDNAPLRRVSFRPGDTVQDKDGGTGRVQATSERGGLIYYRLEGPAADAAGPELCETALSATLSFNRPDERLLAGQLDEPRVFDLRVAALEHQHRRRQSRVRGFVGGRIDLLPHQLYLAAEVTGRLLPRVLLADEVGLGKTIEACLVLHRLLLTGRARRVLILVPEPLIHQWFVELLRRFNLWFHIFDEERCEAIEGGNPGQNPFLDDQLVLSGLNLFTAAPARLAQAVAAGWDLLVVDEAHHLGWSPTEASAEYRVVETLGRPTPGLLLLTATPEQLGLASHFARLRLLDPDRFHNLDAFVEEAGRYREVARLAETLWQGGPLDGPDTARLAAVLGRPAAELQAALDRMARGDAAARAEILEALLDQHGTGRVMFRNTRSTMTGFPRRRAHLHPLVATREPGPLGASRLGEALAAEFADDTRRPGAGGARGGALAAPAFVPDYVQDPRIDWLAGLLRELAGSKVLLICRTQAKVEAIEAALRQRLTVPMAVFHEGLPLVKRDRNAAWFAEDDGAQLLLCSEIGSEGRNFQFAHHLVLFDLPLDPELLEQRLGRLDRIGQRSEIHVHVPHLAGSPQEVLARWYHEGLNSFERNLQGGRELLEQFRAAVHDLAQDYHETSETARPQVDALIAETRSARLELIARLEAGRDRLLELNSFRAGPAQSLVEAIRAQDADRSLDQFMLAVFDQHHIHVEELTDRTYLLGSAGVFADTFPGLPGEGLVVTCDRPRALAREDVQFLTWDHPLVTGALDLLLGAGTGNCSFARWPDPKTSGLYLEAVYLLECIAPPDLHVDRFLPPTPLRALVDHRGNEAGATYPAASLAPRLQPGEPFALLAAPELRDELLPRLLEQAEALATARCPEIVARARAAMRAQLAHEILRLQELQKVNRSVRPEEIDLLRTQQQDLDRLLGEARLRLDAVRLIQRGP